MASNFYYSGVQASNYFVKSTHFAIILHYCTVGHHTSDGIFGNILCDVSTTKGTKNYVCADCIFIKFNIDEARDIHKKEST